MSNPQLMYLRDSEDSWAQNSFGERLSLGGHGDGSTNSAALSALGLLAFLFFLSLIQNSLNTSRWLLLNSLQGIVLPVNTSGIITERFYEGNDLMFSRRFDEIERIERERQKRSSDWFIKDHRITPEFIPTHSIRQRTGRLKGEFLDTSERPNVLTMLRFPEGGRPRTSSNIYRTNAMMATTVLGSSSSMLNFSEHKSSNVALNLEVS